MEKTNVLRILEANSISYEIFEYDDMETDGETVASLVGQSSDMVFKTLVTIGADKSHYVFMIPVNCSLDLKKAAKAVKVKSISMIALKELFPLTGYVHGGCSPVGMKKKFVTVVNDTALLFDKICFSAGRKGMQIKIKLDDLKTILEYEYHDVV
ncbi:MAG: Cys-tRNA(Pro) deacylase [Clostridia bacterium]|nr:Cys-tRNA(Pro) deacylase [Clostridia bacterium]MDD4542382.1 Cys-tRNA(Pro) deacylase [Clostridia bacterium]